MKITLGELAEFMNDKSVWTDNVYVDDWNDDVWGRYFPTLGDLYVPDDPSVVVYAKEFDGSIGWQGKEKRPSDLPDTLLRMFTKWRKARKYEVLVIQVQKDRVPELKKLLKKHGIKI